jgi:hypothetical protein
MAPKGEGRGARRRRVEKMKLKDLRELTKDLPEDTTVWVLDKGDSHGWKRPNSLEIIRTRTTVFGYGDIDENQNETIEVRITLEG